jgi:hypothetical protein
MNARDIINTIEAAGFHLAADGDDILVTPPGQLSEEQRQYLRDHKPAILTALKSPGKEIDSGQGGHDVEPANDQPVMLPPSLIRAALHLCDSYKDTPEQIEQMFNDIAKHPPEQWEWLESYLNETSVRMDLERIPPMVRCSDCAHATIDAGIARCSECVDSGLPIGGFWHDDRHLCSAYWGIAP